MLTCLIGHYGMSSLRVSSMVRVSFFGFDLRKFVLTDLCL